MDKYKRKMKVFLKALQIENIDRFMEEDEKVIKAVGEHIARELKKACSPLAFLNNCLEIKDDASQSIEKEGDV